MEDVYAPSKVRSICSDFRHTIGRTIRRSGWVDFDILNRFKAVSTIYTDGSNGVKIKGLVLTTKDYLYIIPFRYKNQYRTQGRNTQAPLTKTKAYERI